MRVLVTGGAGFVGSRLAIAFRRAHPAARVVALDNLRRRGSETNLGLLADEGVTFVHGDVRVRTDLDQVDETVDVLIDASAEASVLAGARRVAGLRLDTNLQGTLNCLDWARRRAGALMFLSTSRVYSIAPLRDLAWSKPLPASSSPPDQPIPGAGPAGVTEDFPTHLPRSFYGTSKLASETAGAGVRGLYGMRAVITDAA